MVKDNSEQGRDIESRRDSEPRREPEDRLTDEQQSEGRPGEPRDAALSEAEATASEASASESPGSEAPGSEAPGSEESSGSPPATRDELQQRVLEHVRRENYQPVKPRVIAKQLDVPESQFRDLRRAIKRLVKKGRLAYGPGHLVLPANPSDDVGLVTGTFRRTSAGYGFVRPSTATVEHGRTLDIYISARRSLDAASGDLVRVRVKRSRRGDEQRVRGEIVEVVERETHQFVGSYLVRQGIPLVQIDGKVFAEPILVGDPGAKSVSEGDKVVVEMVRFPSHLHPGEGVIVEVLGPRGQPGVDTLGIIREFGLPEEFSEEVLDDARRQAERFDETDAQDRLDLTATTVITIDPVDARDFDDAISLERLDNGHWRLGVHIADVTHFVPPGSPLDREARERGTSVYLPDRVIPMLPEIISNNLASLQPDRPRYARTVLIELTAEGSRVATEVRRSVIRSDRRFTYEEVDEFLEDPAAWREKLTPPVHRLLGDMHALAMLLRRRRLDRGAIELTLPEIKIDLDKRGRVSGAHLVENTQSHQIIEEFMLEANESVAEYLSDREIDFLRRVHGPPAQKKLKSLTQFVRELGLECESLESRFEIKRIVEQVEGEPEEHAVHFAVLRSMQKAVYGPQPEGHYALHKQHYCHFTSPIRRYPDLTVHRLFDELAEGRQPSTHYGELLTLGGHCSDREQRAEQAERELVKIKLLTYFSGRLGTRMEAVITGVEQFGLFAQAVELPAEGFIHISSLQDDYYHYDATTHTLVGHRESNRFRLGDLIMVEVSHVDIDRREMDFRLVQREGRAVGRSSRSGKSAKPSKPSKPSKSSKSRKSQGKPRGKATGNAAGRPKGKGGKARRKSR